jgi:hypothetical protein
MLDGCHHGKEKSEERSPSFLKSNPSETEPFQENRSTAPECGVIEG